MKSLLRETRNRLAAAFNVSTTSGLPKDATLCRTMLIVGLFLAGQPAFNASGSDSCVLLAPPVSYSAGAGATSVKTADFNGDGKPDVVVANSAQNNISVFLGNGDGTLQAGVTYATHRSYHADQVAVADLNRDGKLDLAVVSDGFVSILLGSGTGTFQLMAQGILSTANGAVSVAVGDMNHDGKPDLVFGNLAVTVPWSLGVALGNGDGTFQNPRSFDAGYSPDSIALGDFNGDNQLDVAVAGTGLDRVLVLLGNGDGTLQTAVGFLVPFLPSPRFVEVLDSNLDGKLDLVVTSGALTTTSAAMAVLLGNGDGNFQISLPFSAAPVGIASAVAVSDLDRDGKPDLAVAYGGGVSMLAGNGDGTFQAPCSFSSSVACYSIAVTDFNGDAKPDLAVAGVNSVRVYLAASLPVANAGPDQTVSENALVTLNGSASRDVNTPPRALANPRWRQLSGPPVALATPTAMQTTFAAPSVAPEGAVLVFEFSIENGSSSCCAVAATDTVTISIANVNQPPTANAGTDQTVDENSRVTLAGSGTDPDSDTLTLSWSQAAGPTVALTGADTTNPTFTAPSVTAAQGEVLLKFRLVVNDGAVNSGPDEVDIHVRNVNDPPVANAGSSQSVNETESVTLNGTGSSDPDGDTLTFAWEQIAGTPGVTLAGANTATPSFTAPEVAIGGSTLTFRLTVSDSKASSSGTVDVRINNVNHLPLADAGPDQTVPEQLEVTLLSRDSFDPDGDTLSFNWEQSAGPTVMLVNAETDKASFLAPEVGLAGAVLVFRLTVSDGYGGVATDDVTVNVLPVNDPPVALADAYWLDPTAESFSLASPGVLINDQDPDGPSLQAELVEAPVDGVLNLNADGSFTYQAGGDSVAATASCIGQRMDWTIRRRFGFG